MDERRISGHLFTFRRKEDSCPLLGKEWRVKEEEQNNWLTLCFMLAFSCVSLLESEQAQSVW